jgi:hypothetical protein
MKNVITILTAIALSASAISSCVRSEPEPAGPVDIAGKGGNASIIAIPKHHFKYIDSCTVYIKYNTLDKPSQNFNPSQYDDAVKCVKINDSAWASTFSGLKKGNYYIYGIGRDNSLDTTVVGGKPVTITAESVYNITLYVTEGD